MKKIIYIVSILFVAIVITTIAYALFDFNHENLTLLSRLEIFRSE